MFCPKCATQNVEGASYCRSCGANISLVPQALTGQLPVVNHPEDQYYGRRRGRRPPSMDFAVRSLTMGIAFAVMIAMTSKFAPASGRWLFWLLVPAMLFFGRGFAEIARLNFGRKQSPAQPQPLVNAVRTPDLPAAKTGELMTPVPSVTEGTTRHLATEARTRQLDDQRPS
jgi:zinc ribbon protein